MASLRIIVVFFIAVAVSSDEVPSEEAFNFWLYSFFGLVDCYSKKTVPQITYFTQTLKIN